MSTPQARSRRLLRRLQERLGWPDGAQARRALRCVLHAIGERIPAGEAALLAAELPDELGAQLRHPGPPSSWGGPLVRSDLVRAVAAGFGTDTRTAKRMIHAVLDTLGEVTSPAVVYRVRIALPARRSSASATTSATGMSATNESGWAHTGPPSRSG
jgi:uncharacterized protein (DUF2267 family)